MILRFLIIMSCFFGVLFGQKDYQFIQLNQTVNSKDLAPLDSSIGKYNFYFSGENHMFSTSNSKLEFKLLHYLNEKQQVTNFLLEFGVGTGWLVNSYVNDSTKEVKDIVDLYFNEDFVELFNSIKDFNKEIDSAHTIRVSGIDIQRSFDLTFEILHLLLPKENVVIHDSIKKQIDLIRFIQGYTRTKTNNARENDFDLYNAFDLYYVVNEIQDNYIVHKKLYKDYLGDNFDVFEKTIESMFIAKQWRNELSKKSPFAVLLREEQIFLNLENIVNQQPNQKYYGQFGRAHIVQKRYTNENYGMYNFEPFIAKINTSENPYMKNKVLSIGVFYNNNESKVNYSVLQEDAIEKVFDNIPQDSVIIAKTEDYEDLDSVIKEQFQFIIVNNKSIFKEGKNKEQYVINFTGFSFNIGNKLMDYNPTNTFFGTSFNPVNFNFFNFNMYTMDDFGAYLDFGGDYLYKKESKINDTTTGVLSGWNIGFSVGRDLIKGTRVHVIPSVSFTYQNVNLLIEQFETTNFSEITKTYYKFQNPSYLISGNVELRLRIFSKINLSLKGGYALDAITTKWKYQKQKLAIKNNFGGVYFNTGLAFDF